MNISQTAKAYKLFALFFPSMLAFPLNLAITLTPIIGILHFTSIPVPLNSVFYAIGNAFLVYLAIKIWNRADAILKNERK